MDVGDAGRLRGYVNLRGRGCDVAGYIFGDDLDCVLAVGHPDVLIDGGGGHVKNGLSIDIEAHSVDGIGRRSLGDDEDGGTDACDEIGMGCGRWVRDLEGESADRLRRRFGSGRDYGCVLRRSRRDWTVRHVRG